MKIQIWDKIKPLTARAANAADMKRDQPVMTKQWSDYDRYQAGTKRDIQVVLITPRR